MAEAITQERLRRLADVRPEQGRVLSVFLNLDPSQFATGAARSTAITSVMTEAAHKVEEVEGLSHDELIALREDVERVREVLEGSGIADDGARAVAVYACGLQELLETVPLGRIIESQVVINHTPYVEPLVEQASGERWMVILANRRTARFFSGDGHTFEETDRLEDNVHSQHQQGGWSQQRYERSVDKDKDDHLSRTADLAFSVHKTRGIDHLLVGAPEELVSDFQGKLHSYLQKRLVGQIQVDVENSSPDDVRQAAASAVEEYEKGQEREALDRLEEGVGRGTRGTAGLDDVLGALNQARVEILLLAEGFQAPGRIDHDAAMLYAAGEGSGEDVDDIVDPAIQKAIEQSAQVIVVRYHDDLERHGGIGAVLRY
jgi:peptide chain release factor subunit 1